MEIITSYKDFILDSIPEIRQFKQNKFPWRTNRKGQEYAIITEMKANHKDFAEAVDGLGDELERDDVFKSYENGFYTGFIATLMWGGYHKILQTKSQLDAVLSVGKDNIEKIIAKVDKMLSENRIQDAFIALKSGDCHIKGIGTSYLTKILFFLGKGKSLPELPLIYDNVQGWTHAALLIDDNAVDAKEYYTNQKYSLGKSKKDIELYMDYIKRMNLISRSHDLEPDRLEAYLFGSNTRSKNKSENPRLLTRNYVERFL